jgi:pimeloyl-ACP methyl ester carboxylesterase
MTIAHPQGEHLTVDGRKLWVEREGSGETVLLLSGLGPAGSHAVFHPFFSELARDHEVFYVDLFGRGRSGPLKRARATSSCIQSFAVSTSISSSGES